MPELTQHQIDKLQNGEEITIEVEIWHGDSYEGSEYQMTHTIVLTAEESDETDT